MPGRSVDKGLGVVSFTGGEDRRRYVALAILSPVGQGHARGCVTTLRDLLAARPWPTAAYCFRYQPTA
jgi:hypothetical protein